MEKLSLESEVFLSPIIFVFYSISLVSNDRMSYICHMHTNLVSTACFESHLEETESFSVILKCFESLVVCCSFSSFHRIFYGHFEPIIWITTDDRMNSSCSIAWFSDDESEVGFLYFMVVYEFLEISKGCIIFCDEEESTCIFVQTMYDAWSILSLFAVKITNLCYELIDEGAKSSFITRCWMRIYPRIFAHDDKVIVFKNYLERSMIRGESRWY